MDSKEEMEWTDTSGLFCEVFDNVCFKEPSSKERDLQDKLWMLEVVNNDIWTEQECSLVWNHMRDLKIGRPRTASSIWDHKTSMISDQITRHEVQLAPYYSHFEINGDPCNLIGSQQCDLLTNGTIFALNHICSKLRHSCSKSHHLCFQSHHFYSDYISSSIQNET